MKSKQVRKPTESCRSNAELSLLLAVLAAAGCARSFSDPSGDQAPPRIALAAATGELGEGGEVLGTVVHAGAPVVRGGLHLEVELAGGGPLSQVDFWTPGLPHERLDAAPFTWDVETGDVVPLGGVMLVYVTPYDPKGNAAEPLQLSFVVDNQAPELVDVSPAPGTPLSPGAFDLRFCVRDRPSVTALTVSVDDGGAAAEEDPDAGAHCYVSRQEAEPNGIDETRVPVTAIDDVGNSATTELVFPVHRASAFQDLLGVPTSTLNAFGGPVRVGAGYALVVESELGTGEAWLTAQGASLRALPTGNAAVLPVGGSQGLFVEIDQTDPPPSVQLVAGDGTAVDGGLLPDTGDYAAALVVASTQGFGCLTGSGYSASGPLLCWDARGARAAIPMPAVAGTDGGTTGWMGFTGGKLFVQYADPAAPTDTAVAAFDPTAGFDRLADVPGAPTAFDDRALVDPFGVIEPPAFPRPGSLLDAVGMQRATFSLPPELSNVRLLGVAPGGELLYAQDDAARSQVTIASQEPGGAERVWGCAPPNVNRGQIAAAFDAEGHLYLAWPTLQGSVHVRAFSAPGAFSWEWSGLTGVNLDSVALALDPAESASDPGSTLLLMMPGQQQYAILSRLDPSVPLASPCH